MRLTKNQATLAVDLRACCTMVELVVAGKKRP